MRVYVNIPLRSSWVFRVSTYGDRCARPGRCGGRTEGRSGSKSMKSSEGVGEVGREGGGGVAVERGGQTNEWHGEH